MPITENDVAGLRDGDVISTSGDKIGSIGQVYVDDQTGEPSFVTVNTGLFGLKQSFVPLQGANLEAGNLVVNYDKETVKDAPRIDDDGSLTPEEEDELYSYYGLGGAGTTTDGYDTRTETGTTPGSLTDDGTTDTGYAGDTRTTTDPGYAGTTTGTGVADTYDTGTDRAQDVDVDTDRGTGGDDAMTRSEERLNVGTQTQETGRARLRKYVTTENVTQTVPVQREEVRLEREPITDANVGDATSGPDFTDSEHEVTLREERPVVEKEAVPVERVRLAKDTVTDEETISEDVRKEEIDSDADVDRPSRRDI
jgi:uncharacterized protein (TIGR02271 family)